MSLFSVAGLVISLVATVVSMLAWREAQRSASAAERQALEAWRSVQISQTVALHDAQLKAQEGVPKVSVPLEYPYRTPCALIRYRSASDEKTVIKPAPEKLDPIGEHRIDELGKEFRGIVVNYDTRPIAIMADRGLFVEGTTPLWEGLISLPSKQSAGRYVLNPGHAALFEWFGSVTVIDWYELARMPAAERFETSRGIRVPYTTMIVNYAGDDQWALPALKITLRIERLPVYLPHVRVGGLNDRTLLLLGNGGSGVGCDVEFQHSRVPRNFEDLDRLNQRRTRV